MNQNKILVIEDNPAHAEEIKLFLEESAFQHTFYHSKSLFGGMNILRENAIDLVLLDLSLDDSIGFSTLKNYLKEAPDVPVVVLTSNNNEIVGMQSVKAGAQDFLIKGEFNSKRLIKTIRYSLQRFKAQAKLQKTAEELSITEQRYREVQQMAKFANWEMDIVSNSMKWTDEMFRIFGFQPGSITPSLSDYMDYVHIDDKDRVEAFFEEVIKTGQLNKIEHRAVIKGSRIKKLRVQARVKYDEHTNKILLLGSVQDITELLHQETLAADNPNTDTPLNASEMAFSQLSFNIRTPLASVVNLLFLLDNTALSVQQQELLDDLKTSIDDLSMVLNNLMNFSLLISKNIKIEQEDFLLDEFMLNLKQVLQIKTEQTQMDLRFNWKNTPSKKVKGDSQKIALIIYNLVEEAASVSETRTPINVDVQAEENTDHLLDLKILVTYTGKELDLDPYINNMDDALSLEEMKIPGSKGEGKKLGLTIVSRLLHHMDGRLQLARRSGKKQQLEAGIPLPFVPTTTKSQPNIPKSRIKVLLVEDHALNQIATKKVLTSWSKQVKVDIASNGREGVDKFFRNSYDLILMDLQMPELNGIEATAEIRLESNIPIIALTANASRQEEERCRNVGMNDYLAKPFKPKELYKKILEVLKDTE